jgi:hypothetical protein
MAPRVTPESDGDEERRSSLAMLRMAQALTPVFDDTQIRKRVAFFTRKLKLVEANIGIDPFPPDALEQGHKRKLTVEDAKANLLRFALDIGGATAYHVTKRKVLDLLNFQLGHQVRRRGYASVSKALINETRTADGEVRWGQHVYKVIRLCALPVTRGYNVSETRKGYTRYNFLGIVLFLYRAALDVTPDRDRRRHLRRLQIAFPFAHEYLLTRATLMPPLREDSIAVITQDRRK